MLENILVPLDGSPIADRILPHVAAIAQVNASLITLLRVLETDGVTSTAVDPLAWHFAKAEAQAHLDEAAKQLTQLGLASTTALLEGGAAQRIVEYAHKQGSDLLMLSSHGQGGLSGWNVSGVAQKVIHRANTSIMLVRASDMADGRREADSEIVHYRRILAPLDGSLRAESILPLAEGLTERDSAELLIVHVVKCPEMIQRVPLRPEDAALAERVAERNTLEIEKYFAQLQSRLPAETQTRILIDDSIPRALQTLVEQEQIDLVVLSAHGHSCNTQWPYSALVNSFITYGTTSLFILQDLPFSELGSEMGQQAAVDVAMPTRSANREEEESDRAHAET